MIKSLDYAKMSAEAPQAIALPIIRRTPEELEFLGKTLVSVSRQKLANLRSLQDSEKPYRNRFEHFQYSFLIQTSTMLGLLLAAANRDSATYRHLSTTYPSTKKIYTKIIRCVYQSTSGEVADAFQLFVHAEMDDLAYKEHRASVLDPEVSSNVDQELQRVKQEYHRLLDLQVRQHELFEGRRSGRFF